MLRIQNDKRTLIQKLVPPSNVAITEEDIVKESKHDQIRGLDVLDYQHLLV